MTRIFADANVWLDLYQSAKTGDRLEVFTDLARVAPRFVFTQQLTEEILRNRGRILNDLVQKYRKPALDFNEARKSLHAAAAKVADYLEHVRDDSGDDPVLGALTALFIADGSLVLAYDDDLIDRANRRRLTGQPPGTSSGTLGDELHWEIMLANLRAEDLLIVSRDASFSKHFSLLATEFSAKTGGNLIAVEGSLGGALRRAELAVPDSVREVEEAIRAGLQVDPNRWHLLSTRGDIGIVTDGRFTGATPLNDHDRMRCPVCGAPGPWNGVRCLTCGNMSDD